MIFFFLGFWDRVCGPFGRVGGGCGWRDDDADDDDGNDDDGDDDDGDDDAGNAG